MRQLKLILMLAVTLVLSACQSSPDYSTSAPAPQASPTPSVDNASTPSYGSVPATSPDQALAGLTDQMLNDMQNNNGIRAITADNRSPVVFVDRVNNKTSSQINTDSVTQLMREKLQDADQFQIVGVAKIRQARLQLGMQNTTGALDPSTAIQFGRQLGAQYMLYGDLSNRSYDDNEHILTLRLMDLRSGVIEWSKVQTFTQ